MAIENLHDLFMHTLEDMYFAEQCLVKTLPKLAEKAASGQLKMVLETHLAETREHVASLDRVFELLGVESQAEECPAIEGITEEAEELAKEISDPETRDAALLAAVQTIEHYEITRYGTLVAWAEEMGHDDVGRVLQGNLEDERAMDRKLTQLAEGRINRQAAA
jgi:ferritin-like metal-binding protein YciE